VNTIIIRGYPPRPGSGTDAAGSAPETAADLPGSPVAPPGPAHPGIRPNHGILAAGGIAPNSGATTLVVIIVVVVLLAVLTGTASTGRRRSGQRTQRGRGSAAVGVVVLGAIIGATVAGGQIVRALVSLLGAVAHVLSGLLP
jgi:hypothetical protein